MATVRVVTQSLDNFSQDTIYMDTMIPYALLRAIDPAVKPFFQKLEAGEFQAFTSALTFDELAYRLLLGLIKDNYPGSPLDHLRDNETKLIAEFASTVTEQLEHLRNFPHLIVLDVLASDLTNMFEAMVQYQLRPRDALHVATMERIVCYDLASTDQHFDHIPHIRRFSL